MNKTTGSKCGVAGLVGRRRIIGVVVLLGFIAAGCHTPDNPATAEAATTGTAAIRIRGNTPGQITQIATEVFQEHGYTPGSKRSGSLVFEKQGSKLSNLAYGNWTGDVPIWIRVKLSIISTGEREYTLQYRAYRVRDKGGATEEELKIGKLSSGRYRKLLEEIASRFRGSSGFSQPAPPGTVP